MTSFVGRMMLVAMLVLAPGLAAAQTAADIQGSQAGTTSSAAGGAAASSAAASEAKAGAVPIASSTAGGGQADTSTPNYKLGVGDHVRVNVYNEPDLSGEFTVNAGGTLALPLIGEVPVLGDNATQVADKVQARLKDGYLKDPRVSLEILTYRPFYILGEVTKPGEYPYSNGLTILNAVATAEGFTYRANKRKAFIKRAGTDKEEEVKITPDLQIGPGDTIRIGERYF